jgi:hypothetical protein
MKNHLLDDERLRNVANELLTVVFVLLFKMLVQKREQFLKTVPFFYNFNELL